jgi:hypothetical protein
MSPQCFRPQSKAVAAFEQLLPHSFSSHFPNGPRPTLQSQPLFSHIPADRQHLIVNESAVVKSTEVYFVKEGMHADVEFFKKTVGDVAVAESTQIARASQERIAVEVIQSVNRDISHGIQSNAISIARRHEPHTLERWLAIGISPSHNCIALAQMENRSLGNFRVQISHAGHAGRQISSRCRGRVVRYC